MVAPTAHEPLTQADADVHTWTLRGVEFEDASTTRCFECLTCNAVRYE